MALDFPNSPTNGQIYTDAGTGEQWVYDAPTNSWTSKGLVNTSGGLVFKGSLDITAAPPTGVSAGWQYSVAATGTPNAGFTGLSGTLTKGDVIMYTGTSGWTVQSHTVPDATAVVKGIVQLADSAAVTAGTAGRIVDAAQLKADKVWTRTGTELSPATAGDSVFTTGAVKVGGTTAAPKISLRADGTALTGGKTTVTANGGDLQVSKGITFPATAVACTDVNTLDDYEEGTWSPALTGVTGGSNVATGASAYTKIGNTIRVSFGWRSRGTFVFTPTDPVEITGWPFPMTNVSSTILLNVSNANAGWSAILAGHRQFQAVFHGSSVRLFKLTDSSPVTYGDIFLSPSGPEPGMSCVFIGQAA